MLSRHTSRNEQSQIQTKTTSEIRLHTLHTKSLPSFEYVLSSLTYEQLFKINRLIKNNLSYVKIGNYTFFFCTSQITMLYHKLHIHMSVLVKSYPPCCWCVSFLLALFYFRGPIKNLCYIMFELFVILLFLYALSLVMSLISHQFQYLCTIASKKGKYTLLDLSHFQSEDETSQTSPLI